MSRIKRLKRTVAVLSVILCICLGISAVLGRYAGEWDHSFGLTIVPTEPEVTEPEGPYVRRYFRSNELLPASEGAEYTVNGTKGWFTVANALDSSTVSEETVSYTLTWYVSTDGNTWEEYKKESGNLAENEYSKKSYDVTPVTVNETTYNLVKVRAKTTSFLQEDMEAVYEFVYSTNYTVETSYANGVITVKLDTNDMSGGYSFGWPRGIVPDNSDPNKIFSNAMTGPASLTANLKHNTEYIFLFFVTDESVLAELNSNPSQAQGKVTIAKQ